LHTSPGASVDFSFVAQRLAEVVSEMDVRCIAFDRWHIQYLTPKLKDIGLQYTVIPAAEQKETQLPDGLVFLEHGQGFKDMAPAIDGFEGELLNKRILHGDHPILNWCAANAVAEMNAAGWRKLEKSKSTGRIDGIVALCMAMRVGLTYSEPNEEFVTGRLVAL
jgi:phage terminase large subunit-like protein